MYYIIKVYPTLIFNIDKVPKWIKKWEFNYKTITDEQKAKIIEMFK
jgi:hypothetical protein